MRLADEQPEEQATAGSVSAVPLRVAVASVMSPKETQRNYQGIVQYLGEKLGRPAELVQRQSYAEINELVRNGFVDIAFACGGAYIEGEKEFGMELLAAPQINGETVYFSDIIVNRYSDIQSLQQLRGKTFAFSDPLSNSGRLAPTYALWQMGETPESFFRRFVFTYSHDNSILAVIERIADGAAVDSLVYEYAAEQDPIVKNRTRIIARLGPYGNPPVVVNPRLNTRLKEQLLSALIGMSQDPAGQAILEKTRIDRFVQMDNTAYDQLRTMARTVRWTP